MAKFSGTQENGSGRKTILVADDDTNDIFLLQHAFGKAGVDVHLSFVPDGEQAIRYLKSEGRLARRENPLPALLILDLKMPRMSGFEVLEWVRKQPGMKRLPVVVLTSSEEPKDVDRAYDLGANSYLVKPLDIEHLIRIAEELKYYWLDLNCPPSCSQEE